MFLRPRRKIEYSFMFPNKVRSACSGILYIPWYFFVPHGAYVDFPISYLCFFIFILFYRFNKECKIQRFYVLLHIIYVSVKSYSSETNTKYVSYSQHGNKVRYMRALPIPVSIPRNILRGVRFDYINIIGYRGITE
jgi:hypothetical protein|uniref:Uncharacterized protein n=1 Tax=Sipha flava TaxID=143950 RepID=A0A2S2QJQ9_9HEMI